MNLRLPARIGTLACFGIALAMGLLALRDEPTPVAPPPARATDAPKDPLLDKLRDCQLAGQAAGSDPGCLAAWAENRRRFLGQRGRHGESHSGSETEARARIAAPQQEQ
jgi:conjugative transfer region protein TrbK